MRLLHLSHTNSKGGSFRAYFTRFNNSHIEVDDLDKERSKEEALQLEKAQTYENLGKTIQSNAQKVLEIINNYKQKGITCIGYGASVTSTTLIYNFGIGNQLDYLVDDNPAKIGTISPGHHLPVHNSNKILSEKSSICIILAWRYASEIYRKRCTQVDHKIKYLMPMPSVKWL
jgi:hypothetical protein